MNGDARGVGSQQPVKDRYTFLQEDHAQPHSQGDREENTKRPTILREYALSQAKPISVRDAVEAWHKKEHRDKKLQDEEFMNVLEQLRKIHDTNLGEVLKEQLGQVSFLTSARDTSTTRNQQR